MKPSAIYKVGLTGGIASGKSTVTDMLRNLGATVIDTDAIAKEMTAPGQPACQEIAAKFGPQVIKNDGSLDRVRLARIIFRDANEKEWLESLLHPLIRQRVKELTELAAATGQKIIVYDVPLLFETGWQEWVDEVWTAYVPATMQAERLAVRDGLAKEDIDARLSAQWPIERKAAQADRIINNEGTRETTQRQVETAWKQVLEKCGAP
jgi:dephospho-CoA kinase